MDWMTLVSVALGALLTWMTTVLNERRGERSTRRQELRSFYARWLTQQQSLSLDLRLLHGLIDQIGDARVETARRAVTDFSKLRSSILEITELTHQIVFLEGHEQARSLIQASGQTVEKLYYAVTRMLDAYDQFAQSVTEVVDMQKWAETLESDDPQALALIDQLGKLRKEFTKHYDEALAGFPKDYSEVVMLNAEALEALARGLREELAARWRS